MNCISILGMGNILEGDSGVGCYLLEMLYQEPLSDSVQLFDLGTDPRYAGGYLYGADLAIIIGALELEGIPGKIHRWSYPTFCHHAGWLSQEYPWIGYLAEAFSRVELASGLPEKILFLWIEPAVTDGFVLSDTAHRSMWRAARFIVRMLLEAGCCATTAGHHLAYPRNPTKDSGHCHYGRNPLSHPCDSLCKSDC